MATTAIVWFRRDLRVHDHPSLTAATRSADRVVPVFVIDDALLHGRLPSGPRTNFMLGCLHELRAALRDRGADLVIRRGRPERELARLAEETGADAIHFASDVSPYAMARDRRVTDAMASASTSSATRACSWPTWASRAPRTGSRSACSRRSGAPGSGSSVARSTAPRARSASPRVWPSATSPASTSSG